MGIWYELEPRTAAREHVWKFAHYIETPSEREDGQWLQVLYFRNADRTQFGKVEFLGSSNLSGPDLRSVATKIVKDESYRARYLSDDFDLPKLWRSR